MIASIPTLLVGLAALDLAYGTPISSLISRTDATCPHVPIWFSADKIANGAGLGPNVFPGIDCGFNSISRDCDYATLNSCSLPTTFTVKRQTGTTSVQFADLNGDDQAEHSYVSATGEVTGFLNLGGLTSNPAEVSWVPQGVISPSDLSASFERSGVVFADIDGDGKAEYLYIHSNGSVEAWYNLGGPNDGLNAAQVAWSYNGLITAGIGENGAGIRFPDLNCDGRAEYLWVSDAGAVTAYLNLGSVPAAFPAQ